MSSVFRIESTASILTIDDTDYSIDNLVSIQIEQARTNNILLPMQRQSSDRGVVYSENLGQGVTLTLLIRNVPSEFHAALEAAFDNQETVDFTGMDYSAGNQISATDFYITTSPLNKTVDESDGFSDVTVTIKGADSNYNYGDA